MIYKPVVDKFEVLQLKGFLNIISNIVNVSKPFNPTTPALNERRIIVMAEKNMSRPIVRQE